MSVALFLAISSAFAHSLSVDPSAARRLQLSSLLQHSVGKILSEFGHAAIAKRQTVYDISTQDVVDCVSRTIEYQCGTSGYSQKVVDIATGCRNDSYARNAANTCTRNDKGQTCGAVALKFFSGQTNAESCLGSVANDFCSSECRNFLQSAKDSLGCCLNAYVNKTDYPLFREYREHVDHRLWDLCDVDLPEEECKDSGIKVEFLRDVKSCTSQEILTNFVRYECAADIGQPLVDNLMKNDRCYIFSAVMVDACSSNGNGQYCAETIGTDLMNTFGTDPYVMALNSDCGARGTKSGCSPACKESINTIKNAYGCCVNVYNDSSIGLQLGALSYSVWNECGIESPGFCQQTQTIPTRPPIPTPETDSIPISTDSIPDVTTESVPFTERAPIVSSEQPDIEVIVVTEFIPETTEPDVVTENIESTEENEETEPREPTESTPLEEIETTEPEENEPTNGEEDMENESEEPTEGTPLEEAVTTEPEENEPTNGEEDMENESEEPTEGTPLEEAVTTEPEENEPTNGEEDMENESEEPTEGTPLEEAVTTEPEENEPTNGEEDMENESEEPTEGTPLEEAVTTEPEENEPTNGEEDMENENTQPEEPTESIPPEEVEATEPEVNNGVEDMENESEEPTEGTPLEEAETTEPEDLENEPTNAGEEDMDTQPSEPTESPPLEATEPSEENEPTPDEEDTMETDPTESTPLEEVETTEPEEAVNEPSTDEGDAIVETIAPTQGVDTEPTDGTHPSDHSQTASLPTTEISEGNENAGVVRDDDSLNSNRIIAQTDPPSADQPRGDVLSAQRFNGSVPAARALFSTVIAVGVAVTLFIQQL